MDRTPISVLLDNPLFDWLNKYCNDTGKTKAGLVRVLLLEKKEKIEKRIKNANR